MYGVTSATFLNGRVEWTLWGPAPFDPEEGYEIRIPLNTHLTNREALNRAKSILSRAQVSWLIPNSSVWQFDVSKFRQFIARGGNDSHLDAIEWLKGVVSVTPEIEHPISRKGKPETNVTFRVIKEDFLLNRLTKIFLSHKGADKPKVRLFHSILEELGFDPWLDEDDMAAGTELHRGILQGFKDSCAAVFFITPNFLDEAYLRSEVNYAVQQKNEKGDRFSIITLVFDGAGKAHVPELLQSYVWKEPANDLQALSHIVRALPITLGFPSWRLGL